MSCYFPLHAFKGKSKDAQKIAITFRRSESWRGVKLDLPCGQCIGCRLERSRQWAVRCVHEASLYDRNCFLTLTYDDKNLPPGRSLVLSHFQDFMKRLRKRFGAGIRFFHCGEYGSVNLRPHYHALVFNHDFDDKKFFSGKDEKTVYTSSELSRLWPMGFAVTAGVSFESAAYVARYVMKKVTGKHSKEFYGERTPEYTTMSRRPGIGANWFKKFRGDVYPLDRVVVRGRDTRPPRFYDSLLAKDDPALLAFLKIEREKNGEHFVEDYIDGRKIIVSDSSSQRLAVKEIVKRAEISTLERKL